MDSSNDDNYVNPNISTESFATRTLYTGIRAKFPKAKQLSTESLQELLEQSKANCLKIVLVDVRALEERNVSHIPGALHLLPNERDFSSIVNQLDTNLKTIVVAYCSVGYRSSLLVEKIQQKLQEEGKVDIEVYNLEGSIFKWANENRELVNNMEEPTIYVHPYNAVWGKFLNADRRKSVE